jgi:hypothetical protein
MATKQIPRKDYITYLRMALALSGISIDTFTSELVIENWESIQNKGGEFSIKDSVSIEWKLRKKYQKVAAVYEHKNKK